MNDNHPIFIEHHELSKRSEDMGIAAQLLGLINIAVVWFLILLDGDSVFCFKRLDLPITL